EGDRVGAPPERAGPHPGALRQREYNAGGLRHHDLTVATAAGWCGSGEGGEDRFGDGLIVLIPIRIGRHLNGLSCFAWVELLPPRNIELPARWGVVGAGRAVVGRTRLAVRVDALRVGA